MPQPRREPHRRLVELLDDPRESPAVEIKNWVDLDDRVVAADIARGLLALANYGGGTMIIGFDETPAGCVPSGPCPRSRSTYSQDAINAICARYADPVFHCTARWLTSSTGNEHVVIEVPGRHRVPIRSKRDGPEGSKLRQRTYYIRRPGPQSAPIETAQEWDEVLRRCMSAQRDELLDAFRTIATALHSDDAAGRDVLAAMSGRVPDTLADWRAASERRIDELLRAEAPDDLDRYRIGSYSVAYRVKDPGHIPTLPQLEQTLREIKGRETGWPAFGVFDRHELRTRTDERIIECWLKDTVFGDSAHSDFWRISAGGTAYLLRGFQEDGGDYDEQAGSVLDYTLPIWRIGECLLHARRLAIKLDGGPVEFSAGWAGLNGRTLVARSPRFIGGNYVCRENEVTTTVTAELAAIDDALPELVRQLVEPLYGAFDFFTPPDTVYTEEIAKLREPVR